MAQFPLYKVLDINFATGSSQSCIYLCADKATKSHSKFQSKSNVKTDNIATSSTLVSTKEGILTKKLRKRIKIKDEEELQAEHYSI